MNTVSASTASVCLPKLTMPWHFWVTACRRVAFGYLCIQMAGCETAHRNVGPIEKPPSLAEQIQRVRLGVTDAIVVKYEITDDNLQPISQLKGLKLLAIEAGRISDSGAVYLKELVNLEQLRLWHSPLTDQGIRQLESLKRVRFVNLPHARVSDAGLASIAKMPRVEQLRCGSPLITDAGIDVIRNMPNLRFVHLIDAPITDAGLSKFEGFSQLESLYLDGTNVSDVGIRCFLRSMPGLHFHINQLHHGSDPQKHDH